MYRYYMYIEEFMHHSDFLILAPMVSKLVLMVHVGHTFILIGPQGPSVASTLGLHILGGKRAKLA